MMNQKRMNLKSPTYKTAQSVNSEERFDCDEVVFSTSTIAVKKRESEQHNFRAKLKL
jgi:hypothetical protein